MDKRCYPPLDFKGRKLCEVEAAQMAALWLFRCSLSKCLYCFTHCPGFSPSCNKRHLLCLTLTVQVMGSASAASTGSFTSRWAASPAPVQLGGPACLSFLSRSCHSCRHRYSNAFESVNIEISLRYGFRTLLREVLLFSHITGAAPGPSCC